MDLTHTALEEGLMARGDRLVELYQALALVTSDSYRYTIETEIMKILGLDKADGEGR